MPRVDPATLEHLDEHGYCTVPGVVDEETAAQVRAMMDEFLGPACDHIDFVGRGMQKGTMWPERTAAEGGGPLLTEEGPYMHSLQHPIPDARTALPVEPLAEVMSEVLRCNSVDDLVLVHQNFRRTDPSPGPHPELGADGTFDGAKAGFHQVRAAALLTAFSSLNKEAAGLRLPPIALQHEPAPDVLHRHPRLLPRRQRRRRVRLCPRLHGCRARRRQGRAGRRRRHDHRRGLPLRAAAAHPRRPARRRARGEQGRGARGDV